MTGEVIPFERRRPPGAPGRALASDQNAHDRQAYTRAAIRQEADRLLATGRVVPARITLALDSRGLDGPEVDVACGTWERNPDGDVDAWELALAVPSPEQVRLLAALTGYPIAAFYEPIEPGPLFGPVWMCWSGRRGCELVAANVVDERGVLLYGGAPRELPNPQGALF